MFVREKQFRTSVDALLLNLSISDLGMTGLCFPFIISANFAQEWLHGSIGCTMYGFLSFLFGNGSISTLSAISVERYLIICRHYEETILQRRMALVKILGIIWFQAFVWAMLPITTGVEYTLEPFQMSCTVDWKGKSLRSRLFILGLVVLVLGVNTLIMLFCYICIFYTARKERRRRREIQNVVVTKICFFLVVAFFVCWAPYAVVSLMGSYGNPHTIPRVITVVPVIFAKLSTCLNPVMYVVISKRFRKRYLDTIKCKKRNRLYPSSIVTVQMTLRQYQTNGR
ncbi:visual pigment-like receptor peropsin [Haliotis rubra]|uniref:visual pigment-like receptor peropsin n=1 Tax=Haliotis rubra TaxID=36100 RepID=UPI001EE54B42|nr:visual pigment-like receptor peropsin [Haliotis rubra]